MVGLKIKFSGFQTEILDSTLESMSTVSTVGGPLYSEYSDEYSEYSVSTVSGTQWCH